VKFDWQKNQIQAFSQLRDLLCYKLIFQYPDFAKPFVRITDTSDYAIGNILSQGKLAKNLPIAYTLRLLNFAE
jgi:hypothetical protein